MRALACEFPNDHQLAAIDNRFMLGPSLLITPVLEPLLSTLKGVFPGVVDGAAWYDWYTLEKVEARAGINTTIQAPLGHIIVHQGWLDLTHTTTRQHHSYFMDKPL